MRPNRLKPKEGGVFHITSRVVDRAMKFDNGEKDIFVGMMRRAERFSGVTVLDYCVMTNHFHVFVRVPAAGTRIDEAELLDRYEALYGAARRGKLERAWSALRDGGQAKAVEAAKARYLARMHDVSEFAKTLKQRYSISYNRRHGRKGTLWEERFHSVLAEDTPAVLREVAAYIDLNPVRARIATDPAAYRWSGLGALSSGDPAAREGYKALFGNASSHVINDYVSMISERAASRFPPTRGQALVPHLYTVARIRYFTYGGALGGERFVKRAGTGIACGVAETGPLAGLYTAWGLAGAAVHPSLAK